VAEVGRGCPLRTPHPPPPVWPGGAVGSDAPAVRSDAGPTL